MNSASTPSSRPWAWGRNLVGIPSVKNPHDAQQGSEPTPLTEWPLRCSALFLVIAAVLTSGLFTATGAENAAPLHRIDGSYIKDWLVLGPFPWQGPETDHLLAAGGEAAVRPKEGDGVTTPDGARLTWQQLRSNDDCVNLERTFGLSDQVVAYVYCELQSAQAADTHCRLWAEQSADLWLNGLRISLSPQSVPVQLRAGVNTCLIKVKQTRSEWKFLFQMLPAERAILDVHVVDPARQNVERASVQLYASSNLVAQADTDKAGLASVAVYPVSGLYDLRVTSGQLGAWQLNVPLRPGERRTLEVQLQNAVSISGRVLASDAETPQQAIPVQALSWNGAAGESGLSATVLTDQEGVFRFVNLKPGPYQIRCHSSAGHVFYRKKTESEQASTAVVELLRGESISGINFVLPEIKKGVWTNYPILRGLKQQRALSINQTADGVLWVGTGGAGIYGFNGLDFKTVFDKLAGVSVLAMETDGKAGLWLGTTSGVMHYDGSQVLTYGLTDSFPRKAIHSICREPDGTTWFGTWSGLGKFDGQKFVLLTAKDGLPSNWIHGILRARDGVLWIGTSEGVAHFDGQNFTRFPIPGIRAIHHIHQAKDGAIWLATSHGAIRHDGKGLFRLDMESGLISNEVRDIAQTPDGALWFATDAGVSSYDGTCIVNYTVSDGLAARAVEDIYADAGGVLWFATPDGLSRFDPEGLLQFTKRDGLIKRDGRTAGVFTLESDAQDKVWLGTEWGGAFRIEGTKIEPVPSEPEKLYVRRIHRGGDGALWFGTDAGIYKYDGQRLARVLQRRWVLALTSDDRGHLWFGGGWSGGGLSRLNPQTGESRLVPRERSERRNLDWVFLGPRSLSYKSIRRPPTKAGSSCGSGLGRVARRGNTYYLQFDWFSSLERRARSDITYADQRSAQ
jgi:streptogramin lyase